jgi:dipeptidyl aminopeptidase/acylaminoacyl peptidase
MSDCPSLAPIRQTESSLNIKQLRWSSDGESIVVLDFGVYQNQSADVIKIFNLINCELNPDKTDEIPAYRFSMDNYDKTRRIENFGYDGGHQIALVSFTRNDGFGHLYIYNMDLRRADKITPIEGKCCYRDLSFSPDGSYILFAYQPYEAGARAQLYYIPYGSVGTGASYNPIPLPETFFENTRGKPQPILRPAP